MSSDLDGDATAGFSTAEDWLRARLNMVPDTSIGWHRAGVGFYNKKKFQFAIECFEQSVALDPLNVRAMKIRLILIHPV